MEAVLRPLGMTVTHCAVLELLAQRQGLSNSELARGAFVSRQSMNVLLQSLERDGVVTRPAEAPVGKTFRRSSRRSAGGSWQRRLWRLNEVEDRMLVGLDPVSQQQARRILHSLSAAL